VKQAWWQGMTSLYQKDHSARGAYCPSAETHTGEAMALARESQAQVSLHFHYSSLQQINMSQSLD